MHPTPPRSTLFPYTTLFRSKVQPEGRSASSGTVPAMVFSRVPFRAPRRGRARNRPCVRSEEHTSELQSLTNLVCRLLLEKKNRHGHRATDNDIPCTRVPGQG